MRWVDGIHRRNYEWLGVALGERRFNLKCGTPLRAQAAVPPGQEPANPERWFSRLTAGIRNWDRDYSASLEDAGYAREVALGLRRDPPALVSGVSNALYLLAGLVLERGPIQVRACQSGANHLHAHYRPVLESAFSSRIHDSYGTVEAGPIAHGCPDCHALHVAAEAVLVEVVRADGRPAPPGEVGDVLLTSLRNRATPVIRYRIGDRAVLVDGGPAPCGRGLPSMELVGRTDEFLLTGEGGLLAPRAVTAAVHEAAPELYEFQLRQAADRTLELGVVPAGGGSLPEEDRRRLVATMDGMLGIRGATRVRVRDHIPLTTAGKLRHVVSQAARDLSGGPPAPHAGVPAAPASGPAT
jgi:phenylacetate-CoA ligase